MGAPQWLFLLRLSSGRSPPVLPPYCCNQKDDGFDPSDGKLFRGHALQLLSTYRGKSSAISPLVNTVALTSNSSSTFSSLRKPKLAPYSRAPSARKSRQVLAEDMARLRTVFGRGRDSHSCMILKVTAIRLPWGHCVNQLGRRGD